MQQPMIIRSHLAPLFLLFRNTFSWEDVVEDLEQVCKLPWASIRYLTTVIVTDVTVSPRKRQRPKDYFQTSPIQLYHATSET